MRNKHARILFYTHAHTYAQTHCTKLQIESSCDRRQISSLRFKSKFYWNINNIPESSLEEITTSHNSIKGDFRVIEMVLRTIPPN